MRPDWIIYPVDASDLEVSGTSATQTRASNIGVITNPSLEMEHGGRSLALLSPGNQALELGREIAISSPIS